MAACTSVYLKRENLLNQAEFRKHISICLNYSHKKKNYHLKKSPCQVLNSQIQVTLTNFHTSHGSFHPFSPNELLPQNSRQKEKSLS